MSTHFHWNIQNYANFWCHDPYQILKPEFHYCHFLLLIPIPPSNVVDENLGAFLKERSKVLSLK